MTAIEVCRRPQSQCFTLTTTTASQKPHHSEKHLRVGRYSFGSPATSSGRAFAPLAWTSCHHSIRQCLERSGRFGPLARQLEIFLTASAVDRQLGRANTVLGMVPIKVLQCRQVLCVIALIMLLQCRYQFRLFS